MWLRPYVESSNSSSFNFTDNSFTINLWLLPLTEGGYLMENGIYKSNGWYLRIADNCTGYDFPLRKQRRGLFHYHRRGKQLANHVLAHGNGDAGTEQIRP